MEGKWAKSEDTFEHSFKSRDVADQSAKEKAFFIREWADGVVTIIVMDQHDYEQGSQLKNMVGN